MHPYFDLFGFQLPAYGIIGIVAMAVGGLLMHLRGKKRRLPAEDVFYMFLFALIFMLAGAKVLAVLVALPDLLAHIGMLFTDPIGYVSLYAGGLVFYGGLIGAFVGAYVYARAFRVPLPDFLDATVPVIPLIHAIARVGCFLSGCCYGMEVPWGIAFEHPIGGAPAHVPLMPVQLIESGCNLLIFAGLCLYARRPRGVKTAAWYGISYGVVRFILEFFRGDEVRGHLWLLTTSQWISLAFLAVGIFILCRSEAVTAWLTRTTAGRPKKPSKSAG